MVFNMLSRHTILNPTRMQFIPRSLGLQCLLVLTTIFVSVSNALLCTTCLDPQSCRNSSEVQLCTLDLVERHYQLLRPHNPNLTVTASNVFKCYDLDMTYRSSLTGSIVLLVQKGCAQNETNFCEGWDNTTDINHCRTCNDADDCNKGQTEGTTTPVVPTTPLNNSTTAVETATTEVSNTTTTANSTVTTTVAVTTSTVAVTTTTAASNITTSTPANSTTTTVSTTVASNTTSVPGNSTTTTVSPTTTTTKKPTGGAPGLGCPLSWFALVGFALVHGLIARL